MDININNSKKVNLGLDTFYTVFRSYKDNILPLAVILICIVVLFFVVVPQFQQYLNSNEQYKHEAQKLEVLKNNYNFLSNLDDAKSDKDLETLSQVLPSNKDFVGIMNAISAAASKTGVSIGDFDFSLGDLNKAVITTSSYPSIKIDINLGANALSISKFIKELYKTVPLSEIVSIKTTNNVSDLEILFYYKPFPPQNISDETPVVPLSYESISLIKEVNLWNNSGVNAFLPFIPTASSSSTGSNPSPF